jgi:hypothetical protein
VKFLNAGARYKAAVELEKARDNLRHAAMAGLATTTDFERVRNAERAFDALADSQPPYRRAVA